MKEKMVKCFRCGWEFDMSTEYGGRYVRATIGQVPLCGPCAEDTSLWWEYNIPVDLEFKYYKKKKDEICLGLI